MENKQLPCWAALSIIGMLVLVGIFAWQFPDSSQEWAAWVQAFGSIGAILGAFTISENATKRNRLLRIEAENRERRRLEIGYRDVVLNLSSQAAELAKLIEKTEPPLFVVAWHGYLKSTADASLKAFDSLPTHDMGGTERIAIAFAIREAVQDFFGRLSQLPLNDSLHQLYGTLVTIELPHLYRDLTELEKQLNDCYQTDP
ncbi:MAG: hypothetical protein CML16_03225 [Pusillimonas sp.]|nr:hypothetical protein [Pusillimonas sp.]MBC43599.1 hypothetical protein [Pusillimonas sp.]HCP79400.1 hypothetical protein [Pusillimonas sp.]|tara:strand:+ start:183 stop:785 length:603 start_codon:yes stop_codon:yes gene_type:complete